MRCSCRCAYFIGELIGDIEQFVHNDKQYFPELLKIALVHYQLKPSTHSLMAMVAWALADYVVSGEQGY